MSDGGSAPSSQSRLVAVIAYSGGLLTGVLILLLERRDGFVRFHAMQSIVTFAAVLIGHLLLRGLGLIGVVASLPFVLAVVALWVYLMIRAWRGERHHVPYLGAFAEHLLK